MNSPNKYIRHHDKGTNNFMTKAKDQKDIGKFCSKILLEKQLYLVILLKDSSTQSKLHTD